jgi:hypothetical protein
VTERRPETNHRAALAARIRDEWVLREAQRPESATRERCQRRLDALTEEWFRTEQFQAAWEALDRRITALRGHLRPASSTEQFSTRAASRGALTLGVAGVGGVIVAAALHASVAVWALTLGSCLVSGLLVTRVIRGRGRTWRRTAAARAELADLESRRRALAPRDATELISAVEQNWTAPGHPSRNGTDA